MEESLSSSKNLVQQLSAPNSLLDVLAPDLAWTFPQEDFQAGGEMHLNHANTLPVFHHKVLSTFIQGE